MNGTTHRAQSRRRFLALTATAASALASTARAVEPPEAEAAALPGGVATFEEVWQTVRDRFYDPHLRGVDWPAMRERYRPDAARATSEQGLGRVINRMLSELRASHTQYYTPDETEYYQLADIFAGALRRRGLERAFPGGRIAYPGIGILAQANPQGASVVTGVIDGTPARQAGLLIGDEIVSADGAPFQPVALVPRQDRQRRHADRAPSRGCHAGAGQPGRAGTQQDVPRRHDRRRAHHAGERPAHRLCPCLVLRRLRLPAGAPAPGVGGRAEGCRCLGLGSARWLGRRRSRVPRPVQPRLRRRCRSPTGAARWRSRT